MVFRDVLVINKVSILAILVSNRPVYIKEANKQAMIYVERSLTLRIFCCMLMARLRVNYKLAIPLLVSCMSTYI